MTHYRDLEIYNLSYEAFILIHKFTQKLPRQESYELGSQLRRSADSINSNIVEGYGRRKYVNEYRKFIIYAHASCDESINHIK